MFLLAYITCLQNWFSQVYESRKCSFLNCIPLLQKWDFTQTVVGSRCPTDYRLPPEVWDAFSESTRLPSERRHGHRESLTQHSHYRLGRTASLFVWMLLDIKNTFDSVPKPLILFCWQRIGVPPKLARWLVDSDQAGNTSVKNPLSLEQFDLHGLDDIRDHSFNPEGGSDL